MTHKEIVFSIIAGFSLLQIIAWLVGRHIGIKLAIKDLKKAGLYEPSQRGDTNHE